MCCVNCVLEIIIRIQHSVRCFTHLTAPGTHRGEARVDVNYQTPRTVFEHINQHWKKLKIGCLVECFSTNFYVFGNVSKNSETDILNFRQQIHTDKVRMYGCLIRYSCVYMLGLYKRGSKGRECSQSEAGREEHGLLSFTRR